MPPSDCVYRWGVVTGRCRSGNPSFPAEEYRESRTLRKYLSGSIEETSPACEACERRFGQKNLPDRRRERDFAKAHISWNGAELRPAAVGSAPRTSLIPG